MKSAALTVFLASDSAKSISGQSLPIDGDAQHAWLARTQQELGTDVKVLVPQARPSAPTIIQFIGEYRSKHRLSRTVSLGI